MHLLYFNELQVPAEFTSRTHCKEREEHAAYSSRTMIISLVDSNTSCSFTMRLWCMHWRTMSTSIMMSGRQDFPPRRLRRYLAANCWPVAFSVHRLTMANFPLDRETGYDNVRHCDRHSSIALHYNICSRGGAEVPLTHLPSSCPTS